MSRPAWHILSADYPPRPGGVSDYSERIASALARAGAEVHVWTSGSEGTTVEAERLTVHREAGTWSAADLARLGESLDRLAGAREILLQYSVNMYGPKGVNLALGRWLIGRARGGEVIRTMFHEVAYPWGLREKPTRWLLAAIHRLMARDLIRASSQVGISIPAWEGMLRRCAPFTRRPVTWLPVPSTIPVVDDPVAVASIRSRLGPPGATVLGTFGTYSPWTRRHLSSLLPRLLRGHPDRSALILGRNGDDFAAEMVAARPELSGRLHAPGGLEPAAASHHIQACDVLIQPYIDGVSSRRTTTMAGLAHGRAAVTTTGHLTEPLWAESEAVILTPVTDPSAMISAAESLLSDPAARERLGLTARTLYARRFAVERTVEHLLGS